MKTADAADGCDPSTGDSPMDSSWLRPGGQRYRAVFRHHHYRRKQVHLLSSELCRSGSIVSVFLSCVWTVQCSYPLCTRKCSGEFSFPWLVGRVGLVVSQGQNHIAWVGVLLAGAGHWLNLLSACWKLYWRQHVRRLVVNTLCYLFRISGAEAIGAALVAASQLENSGHSAAGTDGESARHALVCMWWMLTSHRATCCRSDDCLKMLCLLAGTLSLLLPSLLLLLLLYVI